MSDSESFRVGIVGLSPVGRFLLEQLSLLPGFEAVLFQPADHLPDEQAKSLGITSVEDWQRFLYESQLKTVLFLEGLSLLPERVDEAFQAGLPVGLLPPFDWEPNQWRDLTSPPQRRWFVLSPHREDNDFRAGFACLQSGNLASLAAVKRISWVGELLEPETPRPQADNHPMIPDRWLPQLLWEDIDQLLQLTGEPPMAVYAADFCEQPASYLLIFHYPGGLIAHLERRRGTAVPLELGWTITGSAGGYSNGHRHIKTEAGELYEVPVELPAVEPFSLFDPLRTSEPSAGDQRESRLVQNTLAILKAITESARTGNVASIESGK